MPPTEHPFPDPTRIRGDLYARPERSASRTGSLKAARVRGTPVLGTLSRVVGRIAMDTGHQSTERTPLSAAAYAGHNTYA